MGYQYNMVDIVSLQIIEQLCTNCLKYSNIVKQINLLLYKLDTAIFLILTLL